MDVRTLILWQWVNYQGLGPGSDPQPICVYITIVVRSELSSQVHQLLA